MESRTDANCHEVTRGAFFFPHFFFPPKHRPDLSLHPADKKMKWAAAATSVLALASSALAIVPVDDLVRDALINKKSADIFVQVRVGKQNKNRKRAEDGWRAEGREEEKRGRMEEEAERGGRGGSARVVVRAWAFLGGLRIFWALLQCFFFAYREGKKHEVRVG